MYFELNKTPMTIIIIIIIIIIVIVCWCDDPSTNLASGYSVKHDFGIYYKPVLNARYLHIIKYILSSNEDMQQSFFLNPFFIPREQ